MGRQTFNEDYIIFWNDRNVFYLRLTDALDSIVSFKMNKLSLLLDQNNKNTFIRYVRSGSNPKYIAICFR